jgi:hypothetical protein
MPLDSVAELPPRRWWIAEPGMEGGVLALSRP